MTSQPPFYVADVKVDVKFKGHPRRKLHKMADNIFRVKGRRYVTSHVGGCTINTEVGPVT